MRNEISDIRFQDSLIEITPTLDTNIYADEDILFDVTKLPNAVKPNGVSYLNSITICDKDDQGAALDLYFLRSNTSIGTANNAEAMADSVLDEILTIVSVSSADYVDLANGQVAVKSPSDDGMSVALQPSGQPESIYVAAVSQGTGTYTASGLVIKVGLTRV